MPTAAPTGLLPSKVVASVIAVVIAVLSPAGITALVKVVVAVLKASTAASISTCVALASLTSIALAIAVSKASYASCDTFPKAAPTGLLPSKAVAPEIAVVRAVLSPAGITALVKVVVAVLKTDTAAFISVWVTLAFFTTVALPIAVL